MSKRKSSPDAEKPPTPLQRLLELRHTVVDGFELGPLDREDLDYALRELIQGREEAAHAADQAEAAGAR